MKHDNRPDPTQDQDDSRIAAIIRQRELPTSSPQMRTAIMQQAAQNLRPKPRVTLPLRHRGTLGAIAASLLIATGLYTWFQIVGREGPDPTSPAPIFVSEPSDEYLLQLDQALGHLKQRVEGVHPASFYPSESLARASGRLLVRARGMRVQLEGRTPDEFIPSPERNPL